MKLKNTILFLVGLLYLTACGGGSSDGEKVDDIDKQKPTITIIAPASNSSFNAGSDLTVEIDASDDIELNNYVISIQMSGAKSVKTVEEFSFNSQSDTDKNGNELPTIKGQKSVKLDFEIVINEFAEAGVYTLTCTVVDAAGNQEEKETEFTIERI